MRGRFLTIMSLLPLVVSVGMMMAAFNLAIRASGRLPNLLSLLLWVLGTALWATTRIALVARHPLARAVVWLGWYPALLVSWLLVTKPSTQPWFLGSFVILSIISWAGSSVWLRMHRPESGV
jgi:hypothetical protein